MTPFSPEKLVIFDYSGTLSLEAPRFARPVNLLSALAESGLAKLGVATPEAFWGEIVGPTWTRGSTTAIGYKRVMAERITALALDPGAAGAEITAASSRFVDLYLAHSRIDARWRTILAELANDPATAVVIATDHYAEATEAIVRHLDSLDIRAQKADKWAESIAHAGDRSGTPSGPGRRNGGGKATDSSGTPQGGREDFSSFAIANSADIGFWKADRRFWDALRLNLSREKVRSLLMIDDFGFNEEQGDAYAERAKVEARREKTRGVLWEAFQTPMEVITFFLEGAERNPDGDAGRQIEETSRSIRSFLKK